MSAHPSLDPSVVRWSVPADERAGRPVLLLLHGYGSDEHDLLGLVPHLPERFVVASVRAPLAPPWPMPGASWYPIEGLDGRDPDAVTLAAHAVLSWVKDAVGAAPVGLLGFSQGGAVALQTLRVAPDAVSFAVVLAGYAPGGELPGDEVLAERRPPVFWGRGAADDVIPAALVDSTAQWLPVHSELSGRVYPGLTHSISQDELDDVRAFLEARLRDRDAASA
ncbi:phospholipase/carboxylesterase [Microbacterium sp. ru370.1]|uniref:alpha/beta hydrolase n=1 Tax=unclassified Microbacterium TaxID=2609290 RepID=UPI00087E2A96|nr:MULTISPECIES: alpha/beta fold hydrolase [unclassified Microbacterium]SDO43742.1 phospholipase/carboxylesterase [Microbacterium sp. ru370.1]SIT80718.1 phospholipase/carboxylesterase [Microbacterium sp. RU1D]